MASISTRSPGQPLRNEVTFVRSDAQIAIRLTDMTYSAIHQAARDLKSRWIVMLEQDATGGETWGIFDMRRVQKDITGVVFPDPVKTFPIEAQDAAVVYAVTLQGRS